MSAQDTSSTNAPAPPPTPPGFNDVVAQMTGPGGPFEVVVETVRGLPMKNWKNREHSLREKVANAGLKGDLEFLVCGDRRITFGEFAPLVWGAARALENEFGFTRGDRLAVLAMNSPDWIVALFGAVSLGGVGVGLNGWWVADEIEYALNDCGARVLVVDAKLYPRVAPVLAKCPSIEHVLYIGEHPPVGTHSIEKLLHPHDQMPTVPIDEDDPFVILYTSGTTGRPKGCITTHRGTIAQVTGIILATLAGALSGRAVPKPSDPSVQAAGLLTSPLFHVAGLHSVFCVALTAGLKLVMLDGKFEPEKVMQLIQDEKILQWGAIPTMLHRVVHHPKVGDYDLSSLRSISFGGAPTPPETIAKAREVLPIEPTLANAYGLTETHGVATVNGGKDLLDKRAAAGRPMALLELEIRDEDGKPVPDGERGEICFYGPIVTPGYWNKPEATADTVRKGWLHTGDIGYRDADGFLIIADRAKDMIIRGGENVYCTEIEHVLADHPAIDEAAVIGVPDRELGERVKAIVRLAEGGCITVDEVKKHVAGRLARFKVPEFVEFSGEALPRNPAGKLLKNLLRGSGGVTFAPDDPAS